MDQGRLLRRTMGIKLVATYVALIAIVVFFMYPLFYALITALQPILISQRATPTYFFTPTLSNFLKLFAAYRFSAYFTNSFLASVGAMLIALAVGLPAAYAMSRKRFKGYWALLIWLFSARSLPAIGVAVPFFIVFTDIHLIDTVWALIIVFLPFEVALVAWLMKAYFDGVPRALDEAAAMDGCNRLATMLRVILPVSLPGLASTAVLAFLFGWNNFFFPLVLTETQSITVPVALTQFIGQYLIVWGEIMAGIVLLTAPLIIFAIVLRRYMVSGISQGAVRE